MPRSRPAPGSGGGSGRLGAADPTPTTQTVAFFGFRAVYPPPPYQGGFHLHSPRWPGWDVLLLLLEPTLSWIQTTVFKTPSRPLSQGKPRVGFSRWRECGGGSPGRRNPGTSRRHGAGEGGGGGGNPGRDNPHKGNPAGQTWWATLAGAKPVTLARATRKVGKEFWAQLVGQPPWRGATLAGQP